MKKNKALTSSQAHKLYTGDGLGVFTLKLGLGGILMYSASIAFFLLMRLLSVGSFDAAWKEISGEVVVDTFLTVDTSIILAVTELINYDKQFPGGKYFRTVRGGFETYRSMKNAALACRIMALIIVVAFGTLIDITGALKLKNGPTGCLFIGTFLLLGVGLLNFTGLISKLNVRGGVSVIAIMAAGMSGIIIHDVCNGNPIVALIISIVTVPLILVSQKKLLDNYRKNYWNS